MSAMAPDRSRQWRARAAQQMSAHSREGTKAVEQISASREEKAAAAEGVLAVAEEQNASVEGRAKLASGREGLVAQCQLQDAADGPPPARGRAALFTICRHAKGPPPGAQAQTSARSGRAPAGSVDHQPTPFSSTARHDSTTAC